MIISSSNYVDSYTPTVSSQNANYPSTNVIDTRISRKWRTTSKSTSTYKFDATATKTPSLALVLGHNLSTGATVKVQGSTNDFSTVKSTYSLSRIGDCYYKKFSSTGSPCRYWRFYFKDTACSDTYIEVGRLWLGTISTLPGIDMSFPEVRQDMTETQQSVSGQHYADRAEIIKKYTFNMPYMNSTQKAALDTIFDGLRKDRTFITVIDSASSNPTNVKPVYGNIDSDLKYTHIFKHQWKASFDITEVK